MAKLFVFGIGGTGARVIRSLTMLLASGLKLKNIDQVVPILIDPDKANGDLNRTRELLEMYQKIKKETGGYDTKQGFFNHSIVAVNQLGSEGDSPQFGMNAMDNADMKFREYIDLNNMSEANQQLTQLLFSRRNLESDMSIGFKGNPNMGSVALNSMAQTAYYRDFVNKYQKGDKIFIISSIFGGTGSSGFPVLLRNLRNESHEISGSQNVKNAHISAVSLLPYFSTDHHGDSEVNSRTFLGKTKAALKYYKKNLLNNGSLDTLYLLGDQSENTYEHHEGKKEQQNNAHFLELAAVGAIVDFTRNNASQQNNTIIKEFGVKTKNPKLGVPDLGEAMQTDILSPIVNFSILCNFNKHSLTTCLNSRAAWVHARHGVNKPFFDSPFYKENLVNFFNAFNGWLKELENNQVSFSPFDHRLSPNKLIGGNGLPSLSTNELVASLNKNVKKPGTGNLNEHFLELFHRSINDSVTSKQQ